MKIESLKLKNFRGYRDLTEIKFNDLTVFVGKNDIGKSTILEALDIFFNDSKGAVKLEKTDVNVLESKLGNDETLIAVCFTELPDEIVIDSTVLTSLKAEYMLNKDDNLEIVKKYKNGGTPRLYIHALHPSNPKCEDLLLRKNNDLKRIINEEGIECENLTINANMRRAIWDHFSDDLQLVEKDIDLQKEDAKKIWDKLSGYLPVYSLFKSDRENSDSDSEVQDPLKEAVKQILMDPSLKATLSKVADEVTTKLKEVSSRTLDKLREMDSDIAESLNPVIPPVESLKWQDVFKSVSITGDGDIPINKRGSGVKRLILLSFFRAEAERRVVDAEGTGVIYAIEEPETSQHAENQRILIEAFKKLADSNNTQVILTTHSSNIVKQLEFSNIRLVENADNNSKRISEVQPGQLSYPSLNEINYVAFGEATEEYHDELFGYIEYQNWKKDYTSELPKRCYIRLNNNKTTREDQLSLTEYIRHQIHHPENTLNVRYTREELRESIETMRAFIQKKKKESVVQEP